MSKHDQLKLDSKLA